MNPRIERTLFLGLILLLCGFTLSEGKRQVSLESQLPVEVDELYELLATGANIQIVDVRPLEDDENEDVGGYELTHVPGAIPFPACNPEQTPEESQGQLQAGIPTVIVSLEGSPELFKSCRGAFRRIRNLQGGMVAWVDNGLPEDEGEYIAPSMGGGGGCL